MRIDKLHLQDFGQFHEKDITLAPGLNIIFGANEAGKTTTKDFIIDMLYGIDKSRGIGARFDHYEKRRPINGSAYSGSMEISTEETSYLIERNFSKQEKRTVVKNLDTGKEVPLNEDHNLIGALLSTDKGTYMNTLCIAQMETATDKEIADKLNNYIVNMASTKAGDIDAVNAIMELKNKKKEFSNTDKEQKIQELTARLSLERDYDKEIAAIHEEYKRVESETEEQKRLLRQQAEQRLKEEEKRRKEEEQRALEALKEDTDLSKSDKERQMVRTMGEQSILDNPIIILGLGILIFALFVLVAYIVPVNIQKVKIGIMAFGAALAVLTTAQVFARRNRLHQLLDEIEIEKEFEQQKAEKEEEKEDTPEEISVELEPVKQAEYTAKLSELKAKEEQIIKERQEQEQLLTEINGLKEQIAANNVETEALNLAIKTIQELSEEIYDSFGGVLNEQVSEIIARITNDRYSEVKIDDQLRVMVKSGGSFIGMDYLSTSTIEQIYLALRLSIANVLITEDLPIIIDDIFVTYDDQRLYDTLSCLGKYLNRQIIIFTMNPRIEEIFNELGVKNNCISL